LSQALFDRKNKLLMLFFASIVQFCIPFADRASMYHVESVQGECKCIGLDKGIWVVWLRNNVNAHDFKASIGITASCTAGA